MARFTDPLAETSEPPIYTPTDAKEHLTEGERDLFIVPASIDRGRTFLQRLSPEVDDERFLVGPWENETWLLFSTSESELARSIAEDLFLEIGKTGPIAIYSKKDKRVFPIQGESVYAISNEKARQPDQEGSGEDGEIDG